LLSGSAPIRQSPHSLFPRPLLDPSRDRQQRGFASSLHIRKKKDLYPKIEVFFVLRKPPAVPVVPKSFSYA
jgi:hypothetical protein